MEKIKGNISKNCFFFLHKRQWYSKEKEEEKELGDVVVLGPKTTNQKPRPKMWQNSDKKREIKPKIINQLRQKNRSSQNDHAPGPAAKVEVARPLRAPSHSATSCARSKSSHYFLPTKNTSISIKHLKSVDDGFLWLMIKKLSLEWANLNISRKWLINDMFSNHKWGDTLWWPLKMMPPKASIVFFALGRYLK